MKDFFKGVSIIVMCCYNYVTIYRDSVSFYTCYLRRSLGIDMNILEDKKIAYEDEYYELIIKIQKIVRKEMITWLMKLTQCVFKEIKKGRK